MSQRGMSSNLNSSATRVLKDRYCIAEFLTKRNATHVVPYSWIQEAEGEFFCSWPKNYRASEIELAIDRADEPQPEWSEKLIKKVYPLKTKYQTRARCNEKHDVLYKDGSSGLESSDGSSCGTPHPKSSGSCLRNTPKHVAYREGSSDRSSSGSARHKSSVDWFSVSLSPNGNRCTSILKESNGIDSPYSLKRASEFCKPTGFMSKRRCIESTPKTNRLQHDENSSPSNLGSPLLSEGKKTPTPPQKNVPIPPQENVDSDPDDLDKTDFSDSSSSDHDDVQDEMNDGSSDSKYVKNQLDKDKDKSTAEGTITEYSMRRLFRWMLKTNVRLQETLTEIKAVKSLIKGNKLPVKDALPQLNLPCNDLGALESLNEQLQNDSIRKELAVHLIDAARGQNKAWDIAETLFNQIITNDCGKLLVYDGKHARNQKVAIKKTYAKIYEMLDNVIRKIAAAAPSPNMRMEIKKKMGRWLTTRH